jgi:hypothetical protein
MDLAVKPGFWVSNGACSNIATPIQNVPGAARCAPMVFAGFLAEVAVGLAGLGTPAKGLNADG